jgi:hypothetical protein
MFGPAGTVWNTADMIYSKKDEMTNEVVVWRSEEPNVNKDHARDDSFGSAEGRRGEGEQKYK